MEITSTDTASFLGSLLGALTGTPIGVLLATGARVWWDARQARTLRQEMERLGEEMQRLSDVLTAVRGGRE